MTCERYVDTETAERYVAGTLTHDEEVEFEQHFLACDACLDTVRAVEDVRDALVARRAGRQIAAEATAAAGRLAAAPPSQPDSDMTPAAKQTTAQTAATAPQSDKTPAEKHPTAKPAAIAAQSDATSARKHSTAETAVTAQQSDKTPVAKHSTARPAAIAQTAEAAGAADAGQAAEAAETGEAAGREPAPGEIPRPTVVHRPARWQDPGPPAAPAREPYRVPRWVWAAAAALIAGALWLRAVAPAPDHPAIAQNPPSASPSPGSPQSPSRSVPAPPPPAAPTLAELVAPLAIVTPPPYVSVPVRGEATSNTRAFEAAMAHYRARDYAAAADGLRAVVAQTPDAIRAQFFLGIAELMQRRPEPAEAALRRVVASGETPYADEAHFYLAKAALQRRHLDTAERELAQAVRLDAGPSDDARTILERVRALRAAGRP